MSYRVGERLLPLVLDNIVCAEVSRLKAWINLPRFFKSSLGIVRYWGNEFDAYEVIEYRISCISNLEQTRPDYFIVPSFAKGSKDILIKVIIENKS